jgi:hypothetical protein
VWLGLASIVTPWIAAACFLACLRVTDQAVINLLLHTSCCLGPVTIVLVMLAFVTRSSGRGAWLAGLGLVSLALAIVVTLLALRGAGTAVFT